MTEICSKVYWLIHKITQELIVLDVDETLLNPIQAWLKVLNENLSINLTENDIVSSKGMTSALRKMPDSVRAVRFFEEIRMSKEMNSNLPFVDGAVNAINKIVNTPGVKIASYLTNRPSSFTEITQNNLFMMGFPIAPILTRPDNLSSGDSINWKIENLLFMKQHFNGVVVMVDNNLDLGLALKKINGQNHKSIISITIKGLLNQSAIKTHHIRSVKKLGFYIANWYQVAKICLEVV